MAVVVAAVTRGSRDVRKCLITSHRGGHGEFRAAKGDARLAKHAMDLEEVGRDTFGSGINMYGGWWSSGLRQPVINKLGSRSPLHSKSFYLIYVFEDMFSFTLDSRDFSIVCGSFSPWYEPAFSLQRRGMHTDCSRSWASKADFTSFGTSSDYRVLGWTAKECRQLQWWWPASELSGFTNNPAQQHDLAKRMAG